MRSISNDKGFTPSKSPSNNSFIRQGRRGFDDDEQQLREVEDELEEDMAFEVNQEVTTIETRTKPETGRYSDANQQLKRAQTQTSSLKQPTSVTSSVTSIG